MRTAAVAVLLSLARPAAAMDWRWRSINTVGEVAWAGLVILDWAQTRADGFREVGPFKALFASPEGRVDRTRLTAWSLASVGVHAGVSAALPRPYREWWQAASVIVEVGNVGMNFQVGARLTF